MTQAHPEPAFAAPPSLTEARLFAAADELAGRDPDLAAVLARRGPPPLWARPPGFATLLLIILEQQVSLASARATFARLEQRVAQEGRTLTPDSFLALDETALRAAGVSRQKIAYSRGLARDLAAGTLDLDAVARMGDHEAHARLLALHGIGPWSASIYLLLALRRPDVWPAGDLGLIVGMQVIKRLPERPTPAQAEAWAEAWRPWRAVAARLLWSEYLALQRAGLLPRSRAAGTKHAQAAREGSRP